MPRSVSNEVDQAAFLASAYGLRPDEWQEDVLEGWLGRRRDGRWAAATCGLAVPRQNGKNAVIEIRELFGMVALGEKFLHTAHEVKTARKAFLRIASFFENERQFPELAALRREIRKTNGQEAIVLTNGASCEFIARSKGSGRGFTVDVLVCDEAQDLTDEELAALLPTIAAAPSGNPQVVLTGTPPNPDKPDAAQGEVFRRMRRDGEARRDARLAWVDFGVADGPLPNVDDEELWHRVNPALGGRLNVAEVVRERAMMSPERFGVERLGWWGDPAAALGGLFSGAVWAQLIDPQSRVGDAVRFALDVSPALSSATVAVAGFRWDGDTHVEITSRDGVVDHRPGVEWVVPRLVQLGEAFPGMSVTLAQGSAAKILVPALEAAGVGVDVLSSGDVASACGLFFAEVGAGRVRHLGQARLSDAVANAAKNQEDGEGAWKFGRRKSSGDITPLYAATLALYALHRDLSSNYDVLDSVL